MSLEQMYLRLSQTMAAFLIGYLIGGGRVGWLITASTSCAVSALYLGLKPRENDGTRR